MYKETKDKAINFENEFAKRLNELTGELKQEAIADATNYSRQSISNYINGKRIPDAQFVWDFLHTVNKEYNEMGYGNINANYLFGLSDSMLYEDEKIESVCKFSNETILCLKNIAKSPYQLRTLELILQSKGLSKFLTGLYSYIFIHDGGKLDSKLDYKTSKTLFEFNLSKLTNNFILDIAQDINDNDNLMREYYNLLDEIQACKKIINGEIRSLDDAKTILEKRLFSEFKSKGIKFIEENEQVYQERLDILKKRKLKNLKRIYNDRYNIKIDSND